MPLELQLIDDQTVLPFKTRAGGQWPALEGTVRPATPREEAAFDARLRAAIAAHPTDPDKAAAATVEARAVFYAAHLKTWNVAGQPVTPATVARLPAEIFGQLDDVCTGRGGLVLKNSDATSGS